MNYNIVEIKVDKFPVVLVTDSHCDLFNIQRLRQQYKDNLIICLGDIVDLFNENKDNKNQESIEYFIKNKILCLEGNHEQQLVACESGNGLLARNIVGSADYNLTQQHLDFLRGLPRGFKLILPDKKHYLCYHCKPKCLWSFVPDIYTCTDFIREFTFNSDTNAILIGHHHKVFSLDFPDISCKLIGIGALKFGQYALLTENGIENKKL